MSTSPIAVTPNESHASSALRIGVSGSSGLIGGALVRHLREKGHEVWPLVRSPSSNPGVIDPWNDPAADHRLERLHAIVHLAGRPIVPPWTQRARAEIRASRVDLTHALSERLRRLKEGPRTLICGSAVGIYGDRGDETITEASSIGESGFLVDVGKQWEEAARPWLTPDRRLIHLRTGLVMASSGGLLSKLLIPARLGLLGPLGNGRQWMSWIAIEDMIRAIEHLLSPAIPSGPYNLVAPNPVTNAEFTRTLTSLLRRPGFLRVPATPLRWLLGSAADELMLSSTRALPEALEATGFTFQYPELNGALRHILGTK